MNFNSYIVNFWVAIIIFKNLYYILLYIYDYVPDYSNCSTNVNLDSCIRFVKRTPLVPTYKYKKIEI
uniref:Uncharacterized protein n=1 Tax=viral metagenome TaxID=1070528 RepID=A0A6C0AWU2_9ZZZZ